MGVGLKEKGSLIKGFFFFFCKLYILTSFWRVPVYISILRTLRSPTTKKTSPNAAFDQWVLLYLWLCWVFIAVHRLSLVAASARLPASCSAWASHCGGFFCCGACPLGTGSLGVATLGPYSTDPVVVACKLSFPRHVESSRPGIKPVSPALADEWILFCLTYIPHYAHWRTPIGTNICYQ